MEELEQTQNDNRIKWELAFKDKEELKKKLELKDKDTFQNVVREEELQAKVEDMTKQLKEKEVMAEKKTEENFSLKQRIESKN